MLGRVVHQDVQPTEGVDRPTHRTLAERLAADVAVDHQGASAFRPDERRGFLGVAMLLQVDDRDVGGLALAAHDGVLAIVDLAMTAAAGMFVASLLA